MTKKARLILLLGFLFIGPALADKDQEKKVSPEEIRALVTSGELLPLDEILRRNQVAIGGRVIDLHLERKREAYIYDIRVLRSDGRYARIEINARTGLLVSTAKRSD
jgi:uncharacterized membrane protein YkoI